jgi:hypothetical protein
MPVIEQFYKSDPASMQQFRKKAPQAFRAIADPYIVKQGKRRASHSYPPPPRIFHTGGKAVKAFAGVP